MTTGRTGPIRVGTRRSRLARRQTELFISAVSARRPGLRLGLIPIATHGDEDRSSPLPSMGVGVFVKALEEALSRGAIDLVIHSVKDVPTELPEGLEIAPVMARADAREALVNRWGVSLDDLPEGARIGTGSPRRRAQLLAARPDLTVAPMRGNVETRLAKALEGPGGEYDGALLAAAGLLRLGKLDAVSEILAPETFVPAVGQGALAAEIRTGDARARELVDLTAHAPTVAAVTAERAYLRAMGGGCSIPVSAHALVSGGTLRITGFAADPDGVRAVRRTLDGPTEDAAETGARLAAEMLSRGARELVGEVRR